MVQLFFEVESGEYAQKQLEIGENHLYADLYNSFHTAISLRCGVRRQTYRINFSTILDENWL